MLRYTSNQETDIYEICFDFFPEEHDYTFRTSYGAIKKGKLRFKRNGYSSFSTKYELNRINRLARRAYKQIAKGHKPHHFLPSTHWDFI